MKVLSCTGIALALALPASAMQGDRDPAQIVTYQCALCHGPGTGGAPKIGDRKAWEARAARGLDSLVESAARGKGAMPPRGGLSTLTDLELRQAIEHMIARSR